MNETFSNQFQSPTAIAFNAVRNRSFIVGTLSDTGAFSISSKPVFHQTKSAADAERARLAKLNPGTAYISMQLAGGSLVPKVIGVSDF